MADMDIHRSLIVNGWTISASEGVFRAVNKFGQVGFAGTEKQACDFANDKKNKFNKDMNK